MPLLIALVNMAMLKEFVINMLARWPCWYLCFVSTPIGMNHALLKTGIGKLYRNQLLGDAISINDLRERELNGKQLTEDQRLALHTYDRYRLSELNSQPNEDDFHACFMQLQAMANLTPYQEFLKEQYARK